MKILLLFALLLPCTLMAQNKNARKSYKDSTGVYIIEYIYNDEYGFTPAVEGAEVHYEATIQVYKLVPKRCLCNCSDTVQIGVAFRGSYVQGGCFEDVPAEWVKKAKAVVKRK